MKEATLARTNSKGQNSNQYNFCMDPELWIGSPQYMKFYRNFQVVRILLFKTGPNRVHHSAHLRLGLLGRGQGLTNQVASSASMG